MNIDLDIQPAITEQEQTSSDYLPEQVRLSGYRVAEEALTNTLKYAQATTVNVTLNLAEGILELTIKDNGLGFDTAVTAEGSGIGTMLDYSEVVGGGCVVESVPSKGTVVRARFPVQPQEPILGFAPLSW